MKITLDTIRKSIEQKYASFDIDLGDGISVSLLNPLRMARTTRDELLAINTNIKDAKGSDEQLALLGDMILTCASDRGHAKHMLKVITDTFGNDADVALTEIVNSYMEAQQAGEA